MGHTEPRSWLIAYDIADPLRLGRVHRFLKRHAIPVQYSVFVLHANQFNLDHVLAGITDRIDPAWDDVRAYHIPNRCEVTALGRQHLPEGVMFAAEEVSKLLQELTTKAIPFILEQIEESGGLIEG